MAIGRTLNAARDRLQAPSIIVIVVVASVALVAAMAYTLGNAVKESIRSEALSGSEGIARTFSTLTLQPDEFRHGRITAEALEDIHKDVATPGSLQAMRLWDRRFRIVYASSPWLTRHTEMPSEELRDAFAGRIGSEITSSAAESATSEREVDPGNAGNQVEVYVPIRSSPSSAPAYVMEAYLPYGPVKHEIADRMRRLYLILILSSALTLLALTPTLIRASRAVSEARDRRHPALQRAVTRAIKNDEFVLHYQPKVDLGSGRVTGVEALVRWQRGDELVYPNDFVPRLEQTEVMGMLTEHVADLAMRQCAAWRREQLDLNMAINLSARDVSDAGLPGKLLALLAKHGLSAHVVTLEMTESVAVQDYGVDVLEHLSRLGFKLSIDDFGTGQSSLARLDRIPFKELKIDRAFVQRLEHESDTTLVSTAISLAHQLGMHVVVEGVETEGVLRTLTELGCDGAQGYYFGKPVPAQDVPDEARRAALRTQPRGDGRPRTAPLSLVT